MDWQEHFGEVFFETWYKAGLPHHHDFTDEYIQARSGNGFRNNYVKKSHESSPALEDHLLRSIYGFGALHGKMFSEMFKLNEASTKDASDWCGRFNLGISLFDYLCDETSNGQKSIAMMHVFQPFLKTKVFENQRLTNTEEFLSNLADSVLRDIEKLDIENTKKRKSNQLFKLMKQLFDAQYFLSQEPLCYTIDLEKIKKALYLKSAEPFRAMADYTTGLSKINNPSVIENAKSIGKAIGDCYCIIDDAKDVWIDLEAEQWNLFFVLAAEQDSKIFSNKNRPSIDTSLSKIWFDENHAEKTSLEVINRLVKAIKCLEFPISKQEQTLGLISAALWYWYKG